jgi:deazaflavin-dependent oxidoreductase (nitroreductase family)
MEASGKATRATASRERMSTTLRHASQAELAGWERVAQRIAASRPGAWFYVHLAPHLDRPLHRLTAGRLHCGLTWPVAMLHLRGAVSGAPRETPVLYLEDGERIVVLASNGGRRRHPAWYHNATALPEFGVGLAGGEERFVRAREAEGAERDDLWARAVELYAGWASYARRAAPRRIPVLVLEPVSAGR